SFLVIGACSSSSKPAQSSSAARALLVGTFDGHKGQYATIQDAVDAARPGDWILVAPGDYHESNDTAHAGAASEHAGVLITKAGIHLRGMDRRSVIVDGTKAGAPSCSPEPNAQNLGAPGKNGKPS